METLILEQSPLATYLEGKGEAEPFDATTPHHANPTPPPTPQFAPRGPPCVTSRTQRRPVRPALNNRLESCVRQIGAAAVNSTLGNADNERFLEHFQFHIIASQLLNENGSTIAARTPSSSDTHRQQSVQNYSANTTGAACATAAAFAFVWMLHWVQHGTIPASVSWRIAIALTVTLSLTVGLYAWATRQWLQYLRRNAIETTARFVENLQAFEASSISMMGLVQEIELVSRGYRISLPLPPVSRIESTTGQYRKGSRLRRTLQSCYEILIPALISATETVQAFVDQDVVERFLDVYDVHSDDIEEASLAYDSQTAEEGESLKSLRMHHTRYSTLRRLFLCSLLSLQATGRRADAVRWGSAVSQLERLSEMACRSSQKLNSLLNDEDHPPSPGSPSRRTSAAMHNNPTRNRVESHVRRINAMSTGIRSLQAKLYLLREESTRALATPNSEEELSELSASLRDQYEGLGADLQALLQAWESGKHALTKDITNQAHRISRSSSISEDGHRRPPSSGSGLPSVSEIPLPLSPPATEDGSDDMNADDEVFEAISSPRLRQRSTMSREERITKMHDERDRFARQREKQELGTNMVRELQSVMKLRPQIREFGQNVPRTLVPTSI